MQMVVHLVHGTWPYGLFGRRAGAEGTSWTNEGSDFRSALAEMIGLPCEFQEFRWSGKNSFRARAIAAANFKRHLGASMLETPRANHVIIAHSHGGTVVTHALAGMDVPDHEEFPIKEVVCLATPFAYLTHRRSHTFVNALACVIVGMTLGVVLDFAVMGFRHYITGPIGYFFLGICMGALLFIAFSICINTVLRARPPLGEGYSMSGAMPSNIRFTVFRGTRDEAALTIGLFQTLNAAGETWLGLGSREKGLGKLTFSFTFGSIGWLFGVDAAYLLVGIAYLVPSVLHARAVGSTVFLLGGRYDIDVDAVPPDHTVVFRSFHQLTLPGLRHALYDDHAVRAACAERIKANMAAM